ncbi:hypothetical protein IW01_05360 [Pectobacterium brasiliense]|uniref:hypothetical protein n=1 Tax=Pectobacterium TaxID=122277 RepID=UPI0004E62A87|nr:MULTISPECIES: hypothetical protein [Pectobacterium]KFF72049.1 hypothetical protein IW01_05360 [Pectobacterium brasiliense]GLY61749.1 hypothetical protein Pcaca05_26060 [Pectobacterium carotovorum subsp. carotovorum]
MDSTVTLDTYSFIISEILAAISGLFGGLSISFFWQPKKLYRYGTFIAGVIICCISITATLALVGMAAKILRMNVSDADTAMGLGYLVGAISVGLIAFLANFFSYRENKDILDVASELKQVTKGNLSHKNSSDNSPTNPPKEEN